MELNEKQKQGLDIAVERYLNFKKRTVISGYAGTGKSTLIKFIISALPDINPENDVIYTAFTGKAAQVLQKKGNKNVSTLHKLLFKSSLKADGTYYRKPVEYIPYKIVVVDECSMMPKELMDRLESYHVHIIYTGDPGQLPPIRSEDDNHLLDAPHIFLDEIMRQEAESEIIQLTMDIRQGKPLTNFKGKEVQILNQNELTTSMLLWADQVICATNATRMALNDQIRELLGKSGDPQDGDKVICLKNNWDVYNEDGDPLVNGTIGYLKNPYNTFIEIPFYLTSDRNPKKVDIINSEFISDTDFSYGTLKMDKGLFVSNEFGIDVKTTYKMTQSKDWKYAIPNQFTYGYAITGWKAQGSEWDKVLVIEEGFPYDEREHQRFLYTCATRAAKKLVIIRKD